MAERISELRIRGVRTLKDVHLRFDGLTVLIGDNGSGKSTIIECCEILRRATSPEFMRELHAIHGGPVSLLDPRAQELLFDVTTTSDTQSGDPPLRYSLQLQRSGMSLVLGQEAITLLDHVEARPHLRRTPGKLTLRWAADGTPEEIEDRIFALEGTLFSSAREGAAFARLREALAAIDVQTRFLTTPAWLSRSRSERSPMRDSVIFQRADRLERGGGNLANVYQRLKNDLGRAHWEETLDYLRLGLGDGVEDVNILADPGGGSAALALKYRTNDRSIPAFSLSDGELAYLAFVALYQLTPDTQRSLLAFDEPELHLHPQLLARVVQLLEAMGREHGVLIATHSDRLLDALTDPAASVVLTELDEERATRIRRPDRDALDAWLRDYRGVGDVRGAGHEASLFPAVLSGS